ncbi:hypothetical protein [Streptomyces sp. NPDC052721]|uniref:hypothetical protein n=1 Tax=Streptomyces sp. NPDC052721 TaxID=3154955 RepID=UPI00342AE690
MTAQLERWCTGACASSGHDSEPSSGLPEEEHHGCAWFADGRLPAANLGRPALVAESAACPAIRKVRVECLTAWAQLMESPVAERRPDRPVPSVAATAAIGAVVRLPAAAIEEGRDPSSMSGILADSAYRLPPA